MAPHRVKPRPEGTLIEAVARLVDLVGIKRAAELVGASTNSVRRWTDADYREDITAHNVRILEVAAGEPIVTDFLASEASCILLRLHGLDAGGISADFAQVGAKVATLFAKLHQSYADDGRVTADEAGALIRELDEAQRALAIARRDLKAIADGGAA